jgi:hypothetical protein
VIKCAMCLEARTKSFRSIVYADAAGTAAAPVTERGTVGVRAMTATCADAREP